MKSQSCLFLILLMAPLMAEGAKKKKKDRKSSPLWKPSSMPSLNKRFESVYEEMDLNLDCMAEANPKPSVKWLRNGAELKNSGNVEVKKFELSLKSVNTNMSGNYTCIVSNKHGSIEWTFYIDVQAKIRPLIIEGLQNVTQMAGSNVAFRCNVPNDPKATIRWEKVGGSKKTDEITPMSEFLHDDDDDDHILTLDNIKEEDEGEYKCSVGSIWGLNYSSAWLTVTEPVVVTEKPESFGVDKWKNRDQNNMDNSMTNPDKDSQESENMNIDDSLYDGYNPEGLDNSDYGTDFYFTTTTKQPRNRNNNRKKSGRKKNKKGKNKVQDIATTTTTTSARILATTNVENSFRTTHPEIWLFGNGQDDYDGFSDSRYNPVKNNKDVMEESEDMESSTLPTNLYMEGSISSWTIYTIVGAAGGVILLIGLVGITASFCCKKEEDNIYKSTPGSVHSHKI